MFEVSALQQSGDAAQGYLAWAVSLLDKHQGAILFVAGLVAIWGVYAQKGIARRRATLDFIAQQEADKDLIAAHDIFVNISASGKDSMHKYAKKSKENSKETQKIKLVLNQFELVSIGIQSGILDYDMYKKWNRSHVLISWTRAAPFIEELRSRMNNDKLYCEFEYLRNCLRDGHKMRRRGKLLRILERIRQI